MAVLPSDVGAGLPGQPFDLFQGNDFRIVMKTKLGNAFFLFITDMDLLQPLAPLQLIDEPLHTMILFIGDFRKDEGDLYLYFFHKRKNAFQEFFPTSPIKERVGETG